ncbi:MAG: hypothetical protein ACK50U_11390 [Acidobacteriota bacterium]
METLNPNSTPKRTKTMSPAALAANRANALKSTGPRTAQGKLASASNALKHGIFSLSNFNTFVHDNQIAFEVVQNFLHQFDAVTPSEVSLLHQLIHHQLRFLQMERLYSRSMQRPIPEILAAPVPFLHTILQELHRLPLRIERTTKLLRHEIAARHALMAEDPSLQFEPIPDAPPLPEEVFPLPLSIKSEAKTPPKNQPISPLSQFTDDNLGFEPKPINPATGLPDGFDVSTAPLIERLYYCYQSYLRLRPADSPHHPDAFADPIDETQLPD